MSKPDTYLVAVARSGDKLQELEDQYSSERVGIVVGDVANPSTCEKAVALAVSKFGQLNSVIANAGVLDPVETIDNANIDAWKKSFDINFFSVVHLCKEAIPHLRKTKGNIIGVSSGASIGATGGWGCYGSSKAALNHLMLTVAEQEPDIQALAVAPGVVDTSMQKDIREVHVHAMKPHSHKRFTDLYKDKKLLAPEVPATIYVNLALRGWHDSFNGTYLRYSDELLADYAK